MILFVERNTQRVHCNQYNSEYDGVYSHVPVDMYA